MVQVKKGEIGIKEVIYLIIAVLVIILALLFLGFFDEIKEGLVNFFSGSILETFR